MTRCITNVEKRLFHITSLAFIARSPLVIMFLRASTLTLESTWRLLRTASCALQPQPCHTPYLMGTAPISTTATAAAAGLKSESGTALRFYKHASVVDLPEVWRPAFPLSPDHTTPHHTGGIWCVP